MRSAGAIVGSVAEPVILVRARRASCLHVPAGRPRIAAISSKGSGEHVVQDERDPFGRIQSLQHHRQCRPDMIVERHPVRRVGARRDHRVQQFLVSGSLAPGSGTAHQVQAQAAGHHGQPAAHVGQFVRTGA